MVTYHVSRFITAGGKLYIEGECLSSDSKPVTNIMNGSKLIEMDTSKVYLFDESGQTWREWE